MICYLAGPIDFNDMSANNWKTELRNKCNKASFGSESILLFDPDIYKFSKLSVDISKFIYKLNSRAIEMSDIIIMRLMKGQASIGTPIELHYATELGKNVILITDMLDKSAYMVYYANLPLCVVVDSIDDAFSEILNMLAGN
jgi:nucleoside 2-deoxyribosyltransferase